MLLCKLDNEIFKSSQIQFRRTQTKRWGLDDKCLTEEGTWYMEEGLTIFDAMIRNVAGRLKIVNENKWQAVSPSA